MFAGYIACSYERHTNIRKFLIFAVLIKNVEKWKTEP